MSDKALDKASAIVAAARRGRWIPTVDGVNADTNGEGNIWWVCDVPDKDEASAIALEHNISPILLDFAKRSAAISMGPYQDEDRADLMHREIRTMLKKIEAAVLALENDWKEYYGE